MKFLGKRYSVKVCTLAQKNQKTFKGICQITERQTVNQYACEQSLQINLLIVREVSIVIIDEVFFAQFDVRALHDSI